MAKYKKSSSSRRYYTTGQLAGKALRFGAKYAFRQFVNKRLGGKGSARAGNKTDMRFRAGGASTSTYRQISTAYKRRPITRRKKRDLRAVKSFKRTWSKVQGLKSMTLTNRRIVTTTNDLQRIEAVVSLNGLNDDSGADYGFGDIPAIAEVVNGLVAPVSKQRFQINKIVLDMWIKNLSESLAFVDLYEWVLRKDLEASLGTSLNTVFSNIYNQSTTVRGTQELMTDLGWSPFEISEICKRFLILKVNRLQIPAGANFSFHRVYMSPYTPSVNDLNGAATNGMTGRAGKFRGFFVRMAGDQTDVLNAEATSCSFLSRRTYYYSTLFDTYNDQGKVDPLQP